MISSTTNEPHQSGAHESEENTMKRFEELEKLLTAECGKYENDCTKCPYSKECDEYARLYREEKQR